MCVACKCLTRIIRMMISHQNRIAPLQSLGFFGTLYGILKMFGGNTAMSISIAGNR